jgi:hypothetical protein
MNPEVYHMDQAPVTIPRDDYCELFDLMQKIEEYNRRYGCLDPVLRAQGESDPYGPQPERVDLNNIDAVRARKQAFAESDILRRTGLEIAPEVSRMTINSGDGTEIYETLSLRILHGNNFADFLKTLDKNDVDDRFGDYASSIVYSFLISYLGHRDSDPNIANNLLHAKAISDELIRLGIDNNAIRKLGSLELAVVSR